MRQSHPRNLRRSIRELLLTLCAWLVIVSLFLLVRLYGANDDIDWASGPGAIVVMLLLAASVLGGIDWLGNHWINRSFLRAKPYWVLLLIKAISFLFAVLVTILIGRLVAVAVGALPWNEVADSFVQYTRHPRAIAGAVYVIVFSTVIAFIRQSAAMIGPRILLNLMLGRYHRPRDEELIFMFLDLKDSTSYAERLGHRKFSNLLQDCFRDLTDAALRHQVEIYKYVGDEAILTWQPKAGLKNSNCIAAFFCFADILEDRRAYYEEAYHCFPTFKAGINMGVVTVVEVGVLKREIAYLSDVLNTAARVQEKCNEFQCNLLITGILRDHLSPEQPYILTNKGSVPLRGREEGVEILSVSSDGLL